MGGRGAGYRSFTGDRMSRPAKQARAANRDGLRESGRGQTRGVATGCPPKLLLPSVGRF